MRSFRFAFGGLELSSAIALPFLDALPATEMPCDIAIDVSDAPLDLAAGHLQYRSTGRYRLALYALGRDWLIGDAERGVLVTEGGRRLVCHCAEPAQLELLAQILVRRVLPRVSRLFNRLPIHAATLAHGRGAILLLGASGAGKSTMTAALANSFGWPIFSDDMSIIDDLGPPMVLGGVGGVSIWRDSAEGLGLPEARLMAMPHYDGKFWFRPDIARTEKLPLDAILLLSAPDAGIRIERLLGPEVLVMICSQMVPFNRLDANENRETIQRFGRIASTVPVYAVSYPRSYAALPSTLDAIRSLVVPAHAAI